MRLVVMQSGLHKRGLLFVDIHFVMLSVIKRFPQVQYGEPEGCGKKGPAQYCPVRWLKADWRSARSINWNSNPNAREDGYKVDTPQVPSFWSESYVTGK